MNKYLVNKQLEEYKILNLDANNEWIEEYQVPNGYEMSTTYDSWLEVNEYIKYLKDLSKDPSYTVSILGYIIVDEHYPSVVFKVRANFS